MKTGKLLLALWFSAVGLWMFPAFSMAQQSSWSADNDGWILRKKPGGKKYEKFFAIGLWNIPGYAISKTGEPDNEQSNAKLYLEKTKNYNIAFLAERYAKDYMKGVIQCVGATHFPYALNGYLDKVPAINSDPVASPYLRAQYIRKEIGNPKLREVLDITISNRCRINAQFDFIWAPIDEICQGGAAGKWNWPAEVGDIINERIKNQSKDALVFTDLMGVGRGNSYLFEKLYLKTNASLPDHPPMELLSKEARECEQNPVGVKVFL